MDDHENLHACELVARTHPRAPTEWNKCERLRTGSFKPRRIELLWLPEILRVPIRGVHSPVNLLCAGKNFYNTKHNGIMDQIRLVRELPWDFNAILSLSLSDHLP